MFYKIVEVGTDKTSGHVYVLVHFWQSRQDFTAGKPPYRKNDFLMQLRSTGERVVTNPQGWLKRKDGVFVDPKTLQIDAPEQKWEREAFDRDLPSEIMANIEAYWERAEVKGYPPNHNNSRILRDESDPYGVLARPDVAALRGVGVERP